MSKKEYYVSSPGTLKKKDESVYFESLSGKRFLMPINKIDSIHIFGEVNINKKLLEFLGKKNVCLHFYNYYGYYVGSFYPREKNVSGRLLVKQVEFYLDKSKRLFLAKKFVDGSVKNIIKNLEYYKSRGKSVGEELKVIRSNLKRLVLSKSVSEVMSYEGNSRQVYYQSFNKFLRKPFVFDKRSKKPPVNMLNCLISFGNSLLYATVLSEIYKTQLNPTISYLHEPFERRFSLSLDLSELFKPIIVDKVIFDLVNNRKIGEDHFDKSLNSCLLNEKGRRVFLEAWDAKLNKTVKHAKLKRRVSLKHLIRLECYKLIKHLLSDDEYDPIVRWWS